MTQPSLPRGAILKKLGTSQGTITGPMGAQPDTRVKTVEAIGWHRLTEKEQQEGKICLTYFPAKDWG